MTASFAIEAALNLRSRGFNPIPSDPRCGHPIFPYSKARDDGLSEASFVRLCMAGSHNLQVSTGANWGLAVVDLDGDLGKAVWDSWNVFHRVPPTPTVRTPRNGLQLWFAVPDGVARIPNADLWKATDHQGVELLGDGKLAKCPPSYKTIGGKIVSYRWLAGRELGSIPMVKLPSWVLDLASEVRPSARRVNHPKLTPKPVHRGVVEGSWEWRDVARSLTDGDRMDLARSWGLRIVRDVPNAAGWVPCHALDRRDDNPSATFSPESGSYWEPAMGRTSISFFGLAVELGAYPDFATAVNQIGSTFNVPRQS